MPTRCTLTGWTNDAYREMVPTLVRRSNLNFAATVKSLQSAHFDRIVTRPNTYMDMH